MTAPLCIEFNHLYPASPNLQSISLIHAIKNQLYYVFIVCCLACPFLLSLIYIINYRVRYMCVSIIGCSLCLLFIFNEIQELTPAELGFS
jgi:hypothetical protein